MNPTRPFVFAVPVALFAFAARAQDADERVAVLDEYEHSVALADYLGSDDLRVSQLLGAAVRDAEGEEIGEIADLIVSRDNEVISAVIAVGGILGVGDRPVEVSYEELRISPRTQSFFLAMSAEQLAELPEYTPEETELESLLELRERAAGESDPERREP